MREENKTMAKIAIKLDSILIFEKTKCMVQRLTKSKDKKIFGVCGGLGNYFDIDPTVIRIAFIVGFIFFGTGLLLYIILALVIPSE